MPLPPFIQACWDAGEAIVRWVGSAWQPYPAIADLNLQRRLVLRAVREHAPDEWGEAKSEQFTFTELDDKLRGCLWVVVFLWWTLFALLVFGEIVPFWRVRRSLLRNWQQWAAEADPECAQIVLTGDIRRLFETLPRSQRKQLKGVLRELEGVHRHWADFHAKLEHVATQLAAPAEPLLARQAELVGRLEQEHDPLTLASLQRQLRSVGGQIEARACLETWHGRLEAGREECTQGLLHLKSRLALLTASGPGDQTLSAPLALEETAAELHAFNLRLANTQSATEEVLRLGI